MQLDLVVAIETWIEGIEGLCWGDSEETWNQNEGAPGSLTEEDTGEVSTCRACMGEPSPNQVGGDLSGLVDQARTPKNCCWRRQSTSGYAPPLTGMGDCSYLDAGWQPWEHSLVNPTTSSPQFLYIRRAGGRVGSGLRDYWEQGNRGDLPLLVARFHATSGDSKWCDARL